MEGQEADGAKEEKFLNLRVKTQLKQGGAYKNPICFV